MPDVSWRFRKSMACPHGFKRSRYSRSAFARQSQRGVGPPSRCWGQWVGFWLKTSSDGHKDDERWWKMKDFLNMWDALWVCSRFFIWFSCRCCSLSLGMEIENSCFQDPANNSLYSVAGEKRSLEFRVQWISCVKSAIFIKSLCDCKDFESPIVYIPKRCMI